MHISNTPSSSPDRSISRRNALFRIGAGISASITTTGSFVHNLFAQPPMNPPTAAPATQESHEHGDMEELRNELWAKEEEKYQNLRALKEKSPHQVFSAEELERAFSGEGDIVIACMDEGIELPEGQFKVAIAGSGVLCSKEDVAAFLQKVREKFPERKITVTYHEGCGACAAACKPPMHPEELGKETAQEEMKQLGLEGEPARIGFDENNFVCMNRPEVLHPARAIYVDCEGTFNRTALTNIPAGFDLSAAFFPNLKELVSEVRLAINIAKGEHGMGKERFEKQKLLIALIGNPNAKFTQEVKEALTDVLKENKGIAEQIEFVYA